MGDLGDAAEMEAELIQRNRQIAKVRDDLLKESKRLAESKMRNDDLLEKVSELDSEVTQKNSKIEELEKQVVEVTTLGAEKAAEAAEQRKEHSANIENLRKEMEENGASSKEALEAQEATEKKIADLESAKDQLMQDLEGERESHKRTKVALQTAESSNQDTSGRLVETRRRQKELEDDLAEMKVTASNMSVADAEKMQEERAKNGSEINRLTMQMEEHKCMREDLEVQVKEHSDELDEKRVKLEDALRDIADATSLRNALEAAASEAEQKLAEEQTGNKDELAAERVRMQEHLQKAMQKASDLEGRLSGQRAMMDDTNDALTKSELEEEKLHAQMADKAREFEKCSEELKAVLEEEKEKALQEAKAREAKHLADMQTEEVALRHNARSEIDAAERAALEAGDKNRNLESELSQIRADHEESQQQHSRALDSTKNQSTDLKQRLRDHEEKETSLENEVDKLQKEVEEKRLETERLTMSHKLEAERLQHTLEAEQNARNATEKISQSNLEEKDILIEGRVAAISHLEHELEEARKKIGTMEDDSATMKTDHEAKVHQLGMRSAQVEGQLRTRQDQLTEVEGRLEAQRLYLEQVTETLNEVKGDKEGLEATRSTLEGKLRLETSHKDAVNQSLRQEQEDAEKRCKELEERILRDRDGHREQVDEVRRAVGDELRQGAERLAAVEAELLTARQRCELLTRNKTDLLGEVAEFNSKLAGVEATTAEHRDKNETLSLELEQVKAGKESLEQDLRSLREEKRQGEHRVEELVNEAKSNEEKSQEVQDDFKRKVQRLDDLLIAERKLREDTDKNLAGARSAGQDQSADAMALRRKLEQELLEAKSEGESWRDKAEDTIVKFQSAREQLEAQKARADEVDSQRREVESQLRGDLATAEARLRRLETEEQRAKAAVEDGKADMAQKTTTLTAKITELERQVSEYTKETKNSRSAAEAAELKLSNQSSGASQNSERLGMAAEELFTRQVDFALIKQRLSGALEESRRTLRNSLAVPTSTTAIDTVRITGLEQQLAEERRGQIQQAVALQRAERKVTQLESANSRSEEHRATAVANSRDAERRCVALAEDVRKAQIKQTTADQRLDEVRERSMMSGAEIQTVKYIAKYEHAKLRGHLDELRYMIKRSEQQNRR